MNMITTRHMAGPLGVSHAVPVREGMTVAEIAEYIYGAPEYVTAWLKAPPGSPSQFIELPRAMWKWVKPKVGDAVKFSSRPGKGVIAAVLTVVALVVSAVIAPYLVPIIGKFGAALVSAAIAAGANLAINALFPASSAAAAAQGSAIADQDASDRFSNVDSDSNLLAKDLPLPRIAGTRRVSPHELSAPYFFLENSIQAVDRIFGLDGRHDISDIQVDGVPVTDYAAMTTETIAGAETDGTQTFVNKVNKYTRVAETLSSFDLDEVNLVDQDMPANSEPRFVRFKTAYDSKLEELTFRLQLSSFLKSDSATAQVRVPLRLRFRPKGSTGSWYNLPEIHITGRDVSTVLKEIRVRWDTGFGGADEPGGFAYQFFQRVPPAANTLSDGNTGDQWQAHAHFVADTGLTAVQNISGGRNGIRVILDEDTFPKQEYEWEIKRGIAVGKNSLSTSAYTISGTVHSLFVAYYSAPNWRVPVDQGAYVAAVSVDHAISLVNRTPCQRPETALIGLRSKGQSVRNVTCLAKGYAMDWDGSAWATPVLTENPAVHYRQVLYDALTYAGVDTDLIDSDAFVSWRTVCADRGYKVSLAMAGGSLRDALFDIAAAGFARPVFSDKFSIDWFRDRSAELPVQTFSPRNCDDVAIRIASPEIPIGIRAKFQNAALDYRDDEMEVNNLNPVNFSGYEVVEYRSFADADLVRQRATFDLLQKTYQGRRLWAIDAPIEGFVCERGDLVGVITDLVDNDQSGTRIRKMLDGSNFTIDQVLPGQSTESLFDVDNIFAVDDIFVEGEETLALISTPAGTVETKVVAAEMTPDGNEIRVADDLSSDDYALGDLTGAHIVIGRASRLMNRCVVAEIERLSEERARLVLLDEAPEIYAEMNRRFG